MDGNVINFSCFSAVANFQSFTFKKTLHILQDSLNETSSQKNIQEILPVLFYVSSCISQYSYFTYLCYIHFLSAFDTTHHFASWNIFLTWLPKKATLSCFSSYFNGKSFSVSFAISLSSPQTLTGEMLHNSSLKPPPLSSLSQLVSWL